LKVYLGEITCKARPFLKWAGGKGQLIAEIDARLPKGDIKGGQITTYVEPFIGGGAVFFHVAQHYRGLEYFYLIDANEDLIRCYKAVKHDLDALLDRLGRLEIEFLSLKQEERKDFYYRMRARFNEDRDPATLIFLNKTCYNGLYRVNRKGAFNVPFGDYKRPTICDRENLTNVSGLLQNAELVCGDFEQSEQYIDEKSFVYFDPPYRPLSATASFTSYSKGSFSEQDQVRLARFCRIVAGKGAKFLLSNSDPKNEDPEDHFFEDHYKGFTIERVKANRAINCKGSGRGEINELLITNYVLP